MADGIGVVPQRGRIFPVSYEGSSPQQFGGDANRIAVIRILLDTAVTRKRVNIGGTFLWALRASSLSASMQVSLYEMESDPGLTIGQGMAIRGVPYHAIWITNTAQAGAWIELAYAREQVSDIQIENLASSFTSVTIQANGTVSDVADVTVSNVAIQLLPADPNRRAAYITNSSANAMRVGAQATVATNRGVRVAGGASLTVTTTAAVYAIREGAADATANIMIEGV